MDNEKSTTLRHIFDLYLTNVVFCEKKKEQYLILEKQLKKIVDKQLQLDENELSIIVYNFYAMVGTMDRFDEDYCRHSILNVVYSSTPLVTYVYRYFDENVSCIEMKNLTLYMLARLIERVILLTNSFDDLVVYSIINGDGLPHPFTGNPYEYEKKIRYHVNLVDIIARWGGTDHDFLIHVIFLTCLTSFDYHWHESITYGPEINDRWFWKLSNLQEMSEKGQWLLFMGSAKYHIGVDGDARFVRAQMYDSDGLLHPSPANYFGYNYDSYVNRLGVTEIKPPGHITRWLMENSAFLCKLRFYPLIVKFPENAMTATLNYFEYIYDIKRNIDDGYDKFIYTNELENLEKKFLGYRIQFTTNPEKVLEELNNNYDIRIRNMSFQQINKAVALNMSVERRVSNLLFDILDNPKLFFDFPNSKSINKFTPHERNYSSIILGYIKNHWLYQEMTFSFWYEENFFIGYANNDKWSYKLDHLAETERCVLIIRSMVLLCLNLYNTKNACFVVNSISGMVEYVPETFFDVFNVFSRNLNDHGALLGNNRYIWVGNNLVYDCNRAYYETDMEYMWNETDNLKKNKINSKNDALITSSQREEDMYYGIGSNYDTIGICRVVLKLIQINAHLIYEILYCHKLMYSAPRSSSIEPHPYRVNWRCKHDLSGYKRFVERVSGLYNASVDLDNYFQNLLTG